MHKSLVYLLVLFAYVSILAPHNVHALSLADATINGSQITIGSDVYTIIGTTYLSRNSQQTVVYYVEHTSAIAALETRRNALLEQIRSLDRTAESKKSAIVTLFSQREAQIGEVEELTALKDAFEKINQQDSQPVNQSITGFVVSPTPSQWFALVVFGALVLGAVYLLVKE